jgi:hypothetical protein
MQASVLFLISIPSILALSVVVSHVRRRRQRLTIRVKTNKEILVWQDIASSLFHRYGENMDWSERVELALQGGLKKLGIGCGVALIRNGQNVHPLAFVVSNPALAERILREGKFPAAMSYCDLLNSGRDNLAIDFASLSDWRNHSAHQQLGWETFIGTQRSLSSGEQLTIAFFDQRAREHIYTPEEKEFVSQLSIWIGAIVSSEKTQAEEGKNVRTTTSVQLEREISPSAS